jgi:hypothetical protein|tara:strand:- start:1167 stop:1412 length:246 start_codon:yes stop_codon:yes gene_type:complete
MVKLSKHRRILKFFSDRELPVEFNVDEMYQWMNCNKNTNVTRQEMPQLLRQLGGFIPISKKLNQVSVWKYIGDKNVVDRKV